MSLESKIETLTAAVAALTAVMQSSAPNGAASVQQSAPVVQPPVAAPAVAAMPAPPTFMAPPAAAPVAAPAPSDAPFADLQGLFKYTAEAYQALGAERGAMIQTRVMAALGVANVNDIKPEQYGQFYSGVEALKAGQ